MPRHGRNHAKLQKGQVGDPIWSKASLTELSLHNAGIVYDKQYDTIHSPNNLFFAGFRELYIQTFELQNPLQIALSCKAPTGYAAIAATKNRNPEDGVTRFRIT